MATDTKELDALLFELEDAAICSYGDNFTQNEAAKERAVKARAEIKKLFRWNRKWHESMTEVWERGRRAGLRQAEIRDSTSEYFKTREGVIQMYCLDKWMKTWEEVKENPRMIERVHSYMVHLDAYVDKRIEDSYKSSED